MAQIWAEWFYKGKSWKKTRFSYIAKRIKIDGGLCEDCHKELGKIVHHKIHLTPSNINNPDISLDHSNLKYVCKPCHENIEHKKNIHVDGEIRMTFDAMGNPIPK